MKTREFLNQVIDYIEVTTDVIDGLRKQAAEDRQQAPAFSDSALKKTAAILTQAELVSPINADKLVASFATQPDKALESLMKVAELRIRRADGVAGMVGTPAVAKEGSLKVSEQDAMKESDKAFLKHFNLYI